MRLIKNGFGMPGPRESTSCASIARWRVVVRCVATYPVQTGCTPFMSAHAKDTLIAYAASKAPLELSASLPSRLCSTTNRSHSSPANTGWKVDFYRLDSFLFRLDVGKCIYICVETLATNFIFRLLKFENLPRFYKL